MYQVLYRKYRPKVFDDVVGQNHVTSTLSGEVRENRLSHAYLFTGSRGTGKTTCARILAKAVNCLHPVDGNPCNECEICKGIDNGSILDVIEIDAASNRGVDNIRDLRDEANFTPSEAKYRIYIIDEVHMLTIEAFNALLKTLEEPPEHVKFILATTEIHKLPATILSRCQRFDFRRISPEDISARLKLVCKSEKLEIDDEASMLISRIADGGLRDALSLLDQCASVSEHITVNTVTDCAGLANRQYLNTLCEAIRSGDSPTALKTIDELHNASCDMERLCSEMTNYFRDLLISKTLEKPEDIIVCTADELENIKKISQGFTLEKILRCLSVFEETAGNIKRGVNRRVEVEMALIKLCSPKLDTSVDALLSRIAALENKLAGGIVVSETSDTVKNKLENAEKINLVSSQNETQNSQQAKEDLDKKSETTQQKEIPQTSEKVQQESQTDASSEGDIAFDSWQDVLALISERSKPLYGLLSGTSAILRGECVGIRSNNAALGSFIRENSFRNVIVQAIYDVTGKKYRLAIAHGETYENKQIKKKDPLDDLINKMSESDVDFSIN